MSRKFTRNITKTVLKGDNKEPLYTNQQNDLLSDGEDVAVRNGSEYHILTDNIKKITSANSNIEVKVTGKNSVQLIGKGGSGTGAEVNITSGDVDTLEVTKNGDNDFTITPNLVKYATKEDLEGIEGGTGIPTEITSGNDTTLAVTKNSENNFTITPNMEVLATKEDLEGIEGGTGIPTEITSGNETALSVLKNSENNFTITPNLEVLATKEDLEGLGGGGGTPEIPVDLIKSSSPELLIVSHTNGKFNLIPQFPGQSVKSEYFAFFNVKKDENGAIKISFKIRTNSNISVNNKYPNFLKVYFNSTDTTLNTISLTLLADKKSLIGTLNIHQSTYPSIDFETMELLPIVISNSAVEAMPYHITSVKDNGIVV